MADECIKREDAVEHFHTIIAMHGDESTVKVKRVIDALRWIPAADVRPVVRGRWVLDSGGVKCTACGDYPEKKDQCYTPYCCLCGADMREPNAP